MSPLAGLHVSLEDLRRIHGAGAAIVRHTPVLSVQSISERCGGHIVVKAESLQRTGSFELRGALAKLAACRDARGVVAAGAGNHAQAVAYAARSRGIPCAVHMPAGAAIAKIAAVRDLGARVERGGHSVEECIDRARADAEEHGWAFVHPFDDEEIVHGQAGVGLELLDDIPDLAHVIVPIGGGGLVSGVALAVKLTRPRVRVTGVRATAATTIAHGIARNAPGELTRGLIEHWVDDIVTVDDAVIAEAIVSLLEEAKLLAEGAGAAATAALLSGAVAPTSVGTTAAIVSGGNLDPGVLARLITGRDR